MRNRGLVTLATVTTITAAFVAYASGVRRNDEPLWLSVWADTHRPLLALLLLGCSALAAIAEWIRAFTATKQENRATLQRVLNDFAAREFPEKGRKNRITLFKAVSGWSALLHAIRRTSVFAGRHKWKSVRRIRLRGTYLIVFLRSVDARSQKSGTVLRVADEPQHCEGVGGRVWEENFYFLGNLPEITVDAVRSATKLLEDLPVAHLVRRYAEATNIRDLTLLRSMDTFARHFMGSLIRRSDGTVWGVLLLDSEDRNCPFPTNSTGGKFGDRFKDLARLLGKIVE